MMNMANHLAYRVIGALADSKAKGLLNQSVSTSIGGKVSRHGEGLTDRSTGQHVCIVMSGRARA